MQPISLTRLCAAIVWLGAALPLSSARPDEGMWPFESLPLQQLKEKYNFEPTKDWIDHVRLGSVRFDTGGSGSFVSANGLVMTNHHVALTTLQKISTKDKDWVKDGFSSRLYGSEPKGTDLTLRQLVDIQDVTKEVNEYASKGKDATEVGNLRREKLTELAKAASNKEKHLKADPVTFYDGGQFRIYVYHLYDDVRVVFAPEKQVAFYGGDPDNFTYPRFDLDCAFFRVYEDGKPVDSSKWFFHWNPQGAKTDELIFVSGHPGGTERLLTHAEMEFQRDVQVPRQVAGLKNMRDQLKKRMDSDKEAAFELRDQYFGVANSLKAIEGHLAGLRDSEQMAKIKARDDELAEKSGKPEVKKAFEDIAKVMGELKALVDKKAPRNELQEFQKKMRDVLGPAKATINRARFDTFGTSMYPDATFTLRLTWGTVKGYEAGTTMVPPKTTFNGLYERNAAFDNEPPFDLPQRWIDAKAKLNLQTPYNFVCTADIIGGNSGSPILNKNAEIVGLVFDGNIESLPGNYWFDENINRCVGVHSAGMLEAITKIYEEKELVNELSGQGGKK